MPRKPPKTAPKRVTRPKAPQPLDLPAPGRLAGSGIGANLPLPAPKTRVTDWEEWNLTTTGTDVQGVTFTTDPPTKPVTQWIATDSSVMGAMGYGNSRQEALDMLAAVIADLKVRTPRSRWSRLWAWLGRLGRP